MNNQKGVSMIELVIVIIIILMITTFSVYTGKEAADQAMVTEVYTEISSMREAINSINIKRELDSDFVLTQNEHYDEKVSDITGLETTADFEAMYGITVENEYEYGNLYLIYGMDEYGMTEDKYNNSDVRKNYGLDSIKHTYLVNFETGRVDLLESINLVDRNVRTYEQIRALVDDGEI